MRGLTQDTALHRGLKRTVHLEAVTWTAFSFDMAMTGVSCTVFFKQMIWSSILVRVLWHKIGVQHRSLGLTGT